jgi:putative thioredoxin
MTGSQFILDVNEMNFEYEVIAFSNNKPVLVDFWAEWCRPCKTLSPILEKIVNEANGDLRLAKVNIDTNPNLPLQYNVRSIPTVKAFIEGQVAAEFVGVQPETRLRDLIKNLTPPSPIDLELSKAQNLLLSQDWQNAEPILRKVLSEKGDSPGAMLGLAKSLLAQDKPSEALQVLDTIPPTREMAQADILKPYAQVLLNFHQEKMANESDLDAIFYNSIRLASKTKYPIALDGLLDVLRQDKSYHNKAAQKVILAILEIMGEDNPDTRAYRAELASVLF